MTWWRGDDRSHNNAKLLAADLDGTGLYFRAVSWCAQHESDGRVPHVAIPSLAPGWTVKKLQKLCEKLVAIGLWTRTETGYLIEDFLDYNPSRDQLERKRKTERDRRRGGSVPARCEHVDGSVIGPVPSRPVPGSDTSSSTASRPPHWGVEEDGKGQQEAAIEILAERHLTERETARGPVQVPTRWLAATATGLRLRYDARLGTAPTFRTAGELADWLEAPPPALRVVRDPSERTAAAGRALAARNALPPCDDCDSTGWVGGEPTNGKCRTCNRLEVHAS